MPKCPFCSTQFPNGHTMTDHIHRMHASEEAFEKPTIGTISRKKSVSQNFVVVDGNNVVHTFGTPPTTRPLKLARIALKKKGWIPLIIVSSALRYKIDDSSELIRLINLGWVIEAEPKTDDDKVIIDMALSRRCKIITNDRYLDHLEVYNHSKTDIRSLIVKYQFLNDTFIALI